MDLNELKTDEQINKAYDEMLNMADSIVDTNKDNIKDEVVDQIENENTLSSDPEQVMGVYNTSTGEIAVDQNESNIKKISDISFTSFTSNNKNERINLGALAELLDPATASDLKAVETIGDLIERRNNGEKFNVYNSLPDIFRKAIDDTINASGGNFDKNIKNVQSFTAEKVFKNLIDLYKNKNYSTATMDLDAMLAGFSKSQDKLLADNANEAAEMAFSMNELRTQEIDSAIERCKVEGKEDAIAKFEGIKNTLDEAYSLNKFSEYCKTVKIKKFDIEKPSRVYSYFINKYENHKYNINNIMDCPKILERHLVDISSTDLVKLCLAFCKYTMNMSPDNIEDHTFMYYFIRNIIMLDRVNPKGRLYDSMNEKSKEFYDEFTANLRKCIANLAR